MKANRISIYTEPREPTNRSTVEGVAYALARAFEWARLREWGRAETCLHVAFQRAHAMPLTRLDAKRVFACIAASSRAISFLRRWYRSHM